MRVRRKRPRPKLMNIHFIVTALQGSIPMDSWSVEPSESENGVPNVRCSAYTSGIHWTVDIYSRDFYRVKVGTDTADILSTIPLLIGYLNRKLGISETPKI
jgi:hypothetical protein